MYYAIRHNYTVKHKLWLRILKSLNFKRAKWYFVFYFYFWKSRVFRYQRTKLVLIFYFHMFFSFFFFLFFFLGQRVGVRGVCIINFFFFLRDYIIKFNEPWSNQNHKFWGVVLDLSLAVYFPASNPYDIFAARFQDWCTLT